MKNPAHMPSPTTFLNTPLLAGTTFMREGDGQHIYRPGGMDGWVIHATVRGEGDVNRGGERFTSARGDLLLWPPGVAHDYRLRAGCRVWVHVWAYFFHRPHWEPWLNWPTRSQGVRQVHCADRGVWRRMIGRYRDLIALNVAADPVRTFDLGMNALEEIVVRCYQQVWPGGLRRSDPRLEDALALLRRRYREKLSIAELARAANLSPSRFAHLFRSGMGESPMRYLERYRIGRAQALLLEGGLTVAAVAREVGFEDPLYFSRVFRRAAGVCPRRFRRRSAGEPSGV